MHKFFTSFRSLISVAILLLLVLLVSNATGLMQTGSATKESAEALVEPNLPNEEEDPTEQEPPYDPPPPRKWVALELDVVTPEDINVGLGGNVTIVVDVHNWGNVAAENIQVYVTGTDAYRAATETIDQIEPDKHATAILQLELLGRFAYEHPVHITAFADNAPTSNTEIVNLSFNKLKAKPYFGKEDYVNLVVERFLKEIPTLAEEPVLLQFELLEGFTLAEPFNLDLSELVTTEQAADLNLKLQYLTDTGARGLMSVTWDPETLMAEFTPLVSGMYTLRNVKAEEQMLRNVVSSNPIPDEDLPVAWEPQIDLSKVSDFTGSVSYAHPLTISPGPNDIQPPVSWVYSSADANGTLGDIQSLPYGVGWSMTQHVDIIQGLSTCHPHSGGGHTCPKYVKDANDNLYIPYTLNLHGSQYELFHNGGNQNNGDPGRYYAAGNAGLYVEYCKGTSVSQVCKSIDDSDTIPGNGIPNGTYHRSGGFWVVKTPNDKAYRLGYSDASEQQIRKVGSYDYANDPDDFENKAYKWRVDKIKDRFDNVVTYTYRETFVPDNSSDWTNVQTVPSHLTKIEYGNNNSINFSYIAAGSDSIVGWGRRIVNMETEILSGIVVKANNQTVHEYKLNYVWERYGSSEDTNSIPNTLYTQAQSAYCDGFYYGSESGDPVPKTTMMLVKIQDKGSTSQGRAGDFDAHFGYKYFKTGSIKNGYREGTTSLRYCAPYMISMNTLYGPNSGDPNVVAPTVSYTIDEAVGEYIYPNDNDGSPGDIYQYYSTVNHQTVYSGWANAAPDILTYYIYNASDHQGREDSFQGFTDVRKCEGGPCDGAWEKYNKFTFTAFDAKEINSTRTGKLAEHVLDEKNKGQIYYLNNTWTLLSGTSSPDTRHPILVEQQEWDKRNSSNELTRTKFAYDIYGNQVEVQEFGDDYMGSTPLRTTQIKYAANADPSTNHWLVNLPWRIILWDGAVPSPWDSTKILSRTLYYYDGQAKGTPPDEGLLSKDEQQTFSLSNWAETTYLYGGDQGYGSGQDWQLTRVVDPNGVWRNFNWANGTQLANTWDAIGQTVYTYNSTFPWLIAQVQQPNAAKTAYVYDSFGRLIEVKSPDPGTGTANQTTQEIEYHDDKTPFYIDTKTPVPNETNNYMVTRVFYDALGRQLQQRTWGISSDFDHFVTTSRYDSLGRHDCETNPLNGSTGLRDYNAGLLCNSYTRKVTTYDGLDAVVMVKEYHGGHETTTYYKDRKREVTNPLGYKTIYSEDDLGRLISIQEPLASGTGMGHTTSYVYDLSDNLTFVDGPDNADITMSYDYRGNKLSMIDPDMGNWTYDYDDGSRLVRQTDAKNQRFCFYYDDANRLETKTLHGTGMSDCPTDPAGTTLTSYSYHTQGRGKGFIDEITYGTNRKDTFTYDYRGRIKYFTRWIDNIQFQKEFQYDNLDRITKIIYPDGGYSEISFDDSFANSLEAKIDGVTTNVVHDQKFNYRQQLLRIDRMTDTMLTTNYDYYGSDKYYRIEEIQHAADQDEWPNYQYDYDTLGNATTLTTVTKDPVLVTENEVFAYDALNRLTSAEATNGPNNYDLAFTYTDGGNIDTRINTNGSVWTYNYDSVRKHAVKNIENASNSTIASFTYDANGNMLDRNFGGNYDQTWDAQNHLETVTINGETTTFYYDYDGHRILTEKPDGTKIYTPFPDYEEEILPTSQQSSGIEVDRREKEATSRQPQAVTTNLLQNPDFETDTSSWLYSGSGNLSRVTPGYNSSAGAAKVQINATSNTNQFYQYNVTLDADTDYRLSFAGYSNNGDDVKVQVMKHGSPYTIYGLNATVDLTTSWDTYSVDFTTSGFAGTATDIRLRFWFSGVGAGSGDLYYFDDIVLEEVTGGTPTNTPTTTATQPSPTATIPPTNTPTATATDPGPTATPPLPTNTPQPTATQAGPTSTPAANGLLHHYTLDESSGTTAYDSVGNQDGTLVNGPVWQSSGGQISGALEFDGVDDAVDLGVMDVGGSAMTIAFWMKADDFDVNDARFISKATSTAEADHYWMVSTRNDTRLRFRLKTNGTTTTLESNLGTISAGQWTHVATTYDGSQMRIYKDGVQVASVAKTGTIDTNSSVDAALGNQPVGAGSNPFDGRMDDVCIYDWVLGTTELSDIMNNGCGSGSPPPTATNTPQPTATQPGPTPINTPVTSTATPQPGNDVARIQRTTYTLSGNMIGVRVVKIDDSDNVISDELYYTLTNHLGSVVAISDNGGNMVGDVIRYEPFGEIRGTDPSTNPSISDRGFTGHRENLDIGLTYMNARYYVGGIGRFASADTIVPNPMDSQSWNRYSYVRNNPLILVDPSGHRDACGATGASCGAPHIPREKPSELIYAHTEEYGVIDRKHASGKRAKEVIDYVRQAASTGGNITFPISRGYEYTILGEDAAFLTVWYTVSGNIGLDQADGVALAIYMDFEFKFEYFQGDIGLGDSKFAIEDLASDYLGFYAKAYNMNPDYVISQLGPINWTNTGPPGPRNNLWPPRRIEDPDNRGFLPKVMVDGTYMNISWPESMQLTPINDPNLWQFNREVRSGYWGSWFKYWWQPEG